MSRPPVTACRLVALIAFATAPLLSPAQPAPAARADKPAMLPTVTLKIRQHALTAEVANTSATRTVGLMHRFSLRPDTGMLFVFAEPQPLAFWMKNTYIALSIAYIDGGGRIINIDDMAPQSERTHPSAGPAKFALEMKKGWFTERGIGRGDLVEGLDRAPLAKE